MTKSQIISTAVILFTSVAAAQPPLPSTIVIDVENYVEYLEDTADPLKRGSDPNLTVVRVLPNTFVESDHLGDIVSVNGQMAKGLAFGSARVIGATTVPTSGRPLGVNP